MYPVIYESTTGDDYVKDGALYIRSGTGVIVESADDLTEIKKYKPGTFAHVAGYQHVCEADANGDWQTVK